MTEAAMEHDDVRSLSTFDASTTVSSSELARMEDALLSLPGLTREIFLAVRIDDLGYREIARRTGLSTREVERHIARTIVALDHALCDGADLAG